jgi:hypothetical protein
MTYKQKLLPVLAFFVGVLFSGCRLSDEDVVGRYYLHSNEASQPLALELRSDGTFTMYRSKTFGEDEGSITLYKSTDGRNSDISGSGTWKLQTFVRPVVNIDGSLFTDVLLLTRQDGLICFKVRHNHIKEYWCKSQ